jgi:hypothetical protein
MRIRERVLAPICWHDIAQLATGYRCKYVDNTEFQEACRPAYEAVYDKLGLRAREIVDRIRATK